MKENLQAIVSELVGLATALPPHVVTLEETKTQIAAHLDDPAAVARFRRMVDESRIDERHLIVPPARALTLRTIEERQHEYGRHAVDLSEVVASRALASARIDARSIGTVISVSCTGYMLPSLEVHLAHRIGLSPAVRRVPITELGCLASVAAVGLARELLASRTEGSVLIVSTEFPSLCLQASDPAISDVIGGILFGDAAAAVVITADGDGRGMRILGSRTFLWPETTSDLGMTLTTTGFRLQLSRHVPRLIRRHLRATVDEFLRQHEATVSDVSFWAIHPGGPRVVEAIAEALELSDTALEASWDVWQRCGNVSSASALLVLQELLDGHPPAAGSLGMLLAPGPGLSCEMVLLRAPAATAAQGVFRA